MKDELTLSAYKKNTKAIQFYLKNEFKIVEKNIDKENDKVEYIMLWKK